MSRGVILGIAVVLCPGLVTRGEVVIETVTVGNPGNAGELSGEEAGDVLYPGWGPNRICGAVDYAYNIGTFQVTAGQYTEFLNAVAATDTYGLYNSGMDSTEYGCQITQNGTSGNYTYDFSGRPSGTQADWVNRPVNFVSWGAAARFANWLHNGQPTGDQDRRTTEDGSYDLSATQAYYGPDGEIIDLEALTAALLAIVRELDATWVIPSEDEWYKAAYHYNDGATGNYFDYPTYSDNEPGYVNDSGNLSGTGTAFMEGGTDPGNYATYDGDDGTIGIGSPYYRTEVGEWENSASPYDTFDQGGNVYEWNEAVLYGSLRGMRGGSFLDYVATLRAPWRGGFHPASRYTAIGFRVAEVTPDIPAVSEWGMVAMVLLVLTAGTVVFRRMKCRVV